MSRSWPSSNEPALHALAYAPTALQDLLNADAWWEASRPDAPSHLRAELDELAGSLVEQPQLGYACTWRGRAVRRFPLRCGYLVVYRVRPRRRQVIILRVLSARTREAGK